MQIFGEERVHITADNRSGTLDIAFEVVTPPGNSLELYIDSRTDSTACHDAQPFGTAFSSSSPVTNYNEGGTPVQSFHEPLQAVDVDQRALEHDSSGDDGSNDESTDAPTDVDLNRVPMMIGQECTQIEQTVEQENVHRQLTDEEITAAETVELDPDSI